MSKPIDFLKISWIVFTLVSVGLLISYGVTSYQSRIVDKPSWVLCEADTGLKKPQYIKFHNTKKLFIIFINRDGYRICRLWTSLSQEEKKLDLL